jgi:hypothetical protein
MSEVTLLEAGLGALLLLVTPYAHEATHLAASTPWVKGGKIDFWRGTVEIDIPAETRQSVRAWISMAPLLVGLAGLGLLYAGGELPVLTRETFLLYAAGAWFTTPSLMDLREAAGVDHVETDEEPTRKAWYVVLFTAWGFITLSATQTLSVAFSISPDTVAWLGLGLLGGSLASIFWMAHEYAEDSSGSRGDVQTAGGQEIKE